MKTLGRKKKKEGETERSKGKPYSSPRAEWMGIYFPRTSPPVGLGTWLFLPQPLARQPEVPSSQPWPPPFLLPHKLPQFSAAGLLSTSQTARCLPLASQHLVGISHRKSQLSLSCPDRSLTLASNAPGDLEPCRIFFPPRLSPGRLR